MFPVCRWGLLIGKYPWAFMLAVVIVVGVCGSGMVFFTQESRQDKLWVPDGSQALQDKAWVETNFPSKTRFETMLLVADNVLEPKVIQAVSMANVCYIGCDWMNNLVVLCCGL